MERFDTSRRIRDPIHDYIKISEEERKIIDTMPVQRLRRIKQLGLSSLVYPSATHTRFSHSLGVMNLAGMFADSLNFNDQTYRTLRIAGLVHDVGHGPFSHTSDRVARKYNYTHEERSCEILENDLSEVIPDDIDIQDLKDYILSDADVNIIAGDIDADRIDYLNRDTINTGLNYGIIDYQTIVEFAMIRDGDLVFDRKAIDSISEMLSARMYMHNAIVNHHAARLAGTILERALEAYVELNGLTEMMKKNDYTMHSELKNSEDTRISNLYSKIVKRDLPKISYTIRGNNVDNTVIQKLSEIDSLEYERRISETLGITKEDVIIVTPRLPEASPLDVNIWSDGQIVNLEEISQIPKNLPDERLQQSRFHVYTTEGNVKEVQEVSSELLDDELGINS
jgi:HD superfamily phosphohydrolase